MNGYQPILAGMSPTNRIMPRYGGGGMNTQAMDAENSAWNDHLAKLVQTGQRQQQQGALQRQNALAGMPMSNPTLRGGGAKPYQPGGYSGTGGIQSGGQSTPGNGIIQTSIQPQTAYTPEMTQAAANQAIAGQHQAGSLDYLIRQLRRPGQAMTSPGLRTAALPAWAQAQGRAGEAGAMIPLEDAQTNAGLQLSGQFGRENEALGWGRLQSSLGNAQRTMTMDTLMDLIRQFAG